MLILGNSFFSSPKNLYPPFWGPKMDSLNFQLEFLPFLGSPFPAGTVTVVLGACPPGVPRPRPLLCITSLGCNKYLARLGMTCVPPPCCKGTQELFLPKGFFLRKKNGESNFTIILKNMLKCHFFLKN